MAVLVISEDGTFKPLSSSPDANGAHVLDATLAAPTTWFNLLQPNGQWARIGATENGGVLTVCVTA